MQDSLHDAQQSTGAKDKGDSAKKLDEVLWDEFKAIHDPGAPAGTLDELYKAIGGLPKARSALCFSGGGIRSGSFALGVIQGLARCGMLTQFDYLSTVSGGGYIGGWLSAWRRHCGGDVEAIGEKLSQRRIDPPEEIEEIKALRANSNFLTPKVGLTSADTWAGIAIYIRNLLLNWLVLGPLMLAVVLVPYLALEAVRWAQSWGAWSRIILLAAASAALLVAHAVSVANRPGGGRAGITQNQYLTFVALPIYIAAVLLTLYAAQLRGVPGAPSQPQGIADYVWPWALWGAVIYAAAWIIAFATRKRANPNNLESTLKLLLFWTIAGTIAGAIVGLGIHLWGDTAGFRMLGLEFDPDLVLAVFGVGWVIAATLLAELLYVGLASYARYGDMDREWLARSSGWLVALSVARIAFAFTVLASGLLILVVLPGTSEWSLSLGGALGVASGALSSFLGWSKKTPAIDGKAKNLSLFQIITIATGIFLLVLVIALSMLLAIVLEELYAAFWWADLPFGPVVIVASLLLLLLAFSFGVSSFVNINRFSLHAAYRNRIIRAFLGSARLSPVSGQPKRKPDPFTGFDPKDNFPVADLARVARESGYRGLFHVINLALNVVSSGKNLAWQERKAENFVVTPLACGNPQVGFRPSDKYGDPHGISMGTALAISGAAASPNQGYNSSPVVGILMTLFNVRLGWWLGNPKNKSTYPLEGPRLGLVPIVRELFGLTTDEAPYVYLSDGGHFENLGIYEMARRRCRFILISDAGADPNFTFESLGNAIRKIWIDLGVRIEFKRRIEILPKPDGSHGGAYAAVAEIAYPEGYSKGTLVYLKPTLYGDEPPDVRSYKALHPEFPHESTIDQWFSESQMESYRALGEFILNALCRDFVRDGARHGPLDLAEFARGAREKYLDPSAPMRG